MYGRLVTGIRNAPLWSVLLEKLKLVPPVAIAVSKRALAPRMVNGVPGLVLGKVYVFPELFLKMGVTFSDKPKLVILHASGTLANAQKVPNLGNIMRMGERFVKMSAIARTFQHLLNPIVLRVNVKG